MFLYLLVLNSQNRFNTNLYIDLILGVYPQPPGQVPPMQAPGYVAGPPPVQPPPQQVVIVQGPIRYGKNPMTMTCPHCQSQVQTSIRSEPGPLGTYPLVYLYFSLNLLFI